jgi:hypothetical protein
MLLRTTTSSRVALDGQYGPILSVAHLAPFLMAAPGSGGSASFGSSGGGASTPGSVPGSPMVGGGQGSASSAARPLPDDPVARRAFFEVGRKLFRPANCCAGRPGAVCCASWRLLQRSAPLARQRCLPAQAPPHPSLPVLRGPQDGAGSAQRVGDGTVCVATLSHCYVARFKPSGELLPLYSVPQPGAGGHVPVAAWLPHHRRPGGAENLTHGSVSVPYAVLALAWGPRLVLFNVPLIGDHQGGPGTGAAGLVGTKEACTPAV